MKQYYFFLLLLVLLIFSCKSNNSNLEENIFDSVNVDIQDTILSKDSTNFTINEDDIYIVKANSIIFFMPSYKERSEIVKHHSVYTKYDFQHIFNNFEILARYTKQNLRKFSIFSELTIPYSFIKLFLCASFKKVSSISEANTF